MRILMVASEAAPYATTGRLGDALGALARALVRTGHEVDLVIPRYRGVDAGSPVGRIAIAFGGLRDEVELFCDRRDGVRTLLVEHPSYFGREYLYGAGGHGYPDNPERFAMLAQAALNWSVQAGQPHEVVHAHDWQAGLVPVLAGRMFRGQSPMRRLPSVFTIHSVAYQGVFDASWLIRLGLGWDLMRPEAMEFWGRISYLKAGIVFSRLVTAVSPTYVEEIQTPELGLGFDGILRERAGDLVGILHGIDYDRWDPGRDPALPEPFTAQAPGGRAAAKRALREAFRLPVDPEALSRPLVGIVSRLADDQGFDLLAQVADELPRLGATFVLLGTGERRHEDLWLGLAARHPGRVGVVIGDDDRLARLVRGGTDLMLLPARFEPSGHAAMQALRYGAVPLVRATGGLKDAVRNFDPASGEGTGFTFDEYSAAALLGTLRWAVGVFQDKDAWPRIQAAGMREDFSWDRAAQHYAAVYQRAAAARVWS